MTDQPIPIRPELKHLERKETSLANCTYCGIAICDLNEREARLVAMEMGALYTQSLGDRIPIPSYR